MVSLIIRIFGNSLALYAAFLFVPGFAFRGGLKEYALAGVLLAALNLVVKPVLKTISLPLIILTLGLFSIIINGLILWTVDYIFDFMTIQNFYALLWSTVIVTLVNLLVSKSAKIIT